MTIVLKKNQFYQLLRRVIRYEGEICVYVGANGYTFNRKEIGETKHSSKQLLFG